jgi:hypothetical protein
VTVEPVENETSQAELVPAEGVPGGDLERALGGVMRLSELQEVRQEKVEEFRDRGIDPYPPRTHRSSTAGEAKERFRAIEPS